MMGFDIIVAVDNHRGIGIDNTLPWKLSADMQWFKQKTMAEDPAQENVVIMGRKTWDSIPDRFRPLRGRKNLVITRSPEKCRAPYTAADFEQALQKAYTLGGDIFVIGGSSIYALALRHGDLRNLYVTEIDRDFHCNRFFPDYSHLSCQQLISSGEENGLPFAIKHYSR